MNLPCPELELMHNCEKNKRFSDHIARIDFFGSLYLNIHPREATELKKKVKIQRRVSILVYRTNLFRYLQNVINYMNIPTYISALALSKS